MPVFRGTHEMRVVVDQPWDHGATIEIHDAGRRPFELLDIGGAADRDDALALDRKRLGDREAVVDGDDLAVEEHGVRRRLRRRGVAPGGRHGSNDKGTYDGPHDCLPALQVCSLSKATVPLDRAGSARLHAPLLEGRTAASAAMNLTDILQMNSGTVWTIADGKVPAKPVGGLRSASGVGPFRTTSSRTSLDRRVRPVELPQCARGERVFPISVYDTMTVD